LLTVHWNAATLPTEQYTPAVAIIDADLGAVGVAGKKEQEAGDTTEVRQSAKRDATLDCRARFGHCQLPDSLASA